jgi:CheY-like chemotaxis protein
VEQAGSVLLVGEDDAFDMYGEFLRAHGLLPTVRRSPGDAILEIAVTPPDVVVTELVFGGRTGTGCEFISAIRQDSATRDSIILVVSGYVRAQDRQLARQCGADRFFAKPLLPLALLDEVLNGLTCRRERRRPTWNASLPTGDRRRRARRRRS